MCGRFAFFSPAEAIAAAFNAAVDFQTVPRYNIAPSQEVAAIFIDKQGSRVADGFRWGLVPFWAKDPAIGNRMINARAETIAEKPSYRQSFSRRRCLVLANGFYEWRKEAGGKIPYFISRADSEPFGMAGLWDEWQGDDGPLRTCTIVTTVANAFMQDLHHRMPVLLEKQSADTWFDPAAATEDLQSMLLTPPAVELQAWPVSRQVNNPVNDAPELVEPQTA